MNGIDATLRLRAGAALVAWSFLGVPAVAAPSPVPSSLPNPTPASASPAAPAPPEGAPGSVTAPSPSPGPPGPLAPPAGPQIGQRAPAFTLRTLDGKTVTLASYAGKTLVINAWATWCPPCREEMPGYIAAAAQLGRRNVALLGVDTTEGEPVVRAYAAAKAVPYALAVTTNDDFTNAYDVRYFPTTIVIDPHGIVRARIVDVVSRAQLATYAAAAAGGRSVTLVSNLQQQIDARLGDPAIVFGDDAPSVEANARKAVAAIDASEDLLENADGSKGRGADYLRTRAEQGALRDRAIAALVNVGTSVSDKTLLARLQAAAASDRGSWSEAAQAYRAVLALAPNDTDALDGLATASYEARDYASAADAKGKLAALAPANVETLVGFARYQAAAGQNDAARGTFGHAIAVAEQQVVAARGRPLPLRMLAYAHLYAGRNAATSGDPAAARAEFDDVARLAAQLPASDARHDMYIEEAQEATVALELGGARGLVLSLAPWTGPDLPGSIASTYKYRLAVAGRAGRTVSLAASHLPKSWIASFCSDATCAPFKTSFDLPASGVKIVEFALIPPDARAARPKVRIDGSDGRSKATAST